MKSSIVFGPSSHQFSAIVVSCVSVWLYLLDLEAMSWKSEFKCFFLQTDAISGI